MGILSRLGRPFHTAFFAWVAALCGCKPAVDARTMAAVQVVTKTEPPAGCRLVGTMEGKDTDRWKPGGLTYDAAVSDLKKKAVLGGGNYAVIDSERPPQTGDYPLPSYTVRSRVFACPIAQPSPAAKPAQPTTPPPPAARRCEPDCSPGYTCLRGSCVSACNPPCGAGERCQADRMCYPWPSAQPLPSASAPQPTPP